MHDDKEYRDAVISIRNSLEHLVNTINGIEKPSRYKRMAQHLLSGILRGVGMAIGFSVVSALLLSFLTLLANANIPLIGKFIAQIVEFVQLSLK